MMMGMDQSETLSSKLDLIYYTLFLQVHRALLTLSPATTCWAKTHFPEPNWHMLDFKRKGSESQRPNQVRKKGCRVRECMLCGREKLINKIVPDMCTLHSPMIVNLTFLMWVQANSTFWNLYSYWTNVSFACKKGFLFIHFRWWFLKVSM
jgi:hypothetical protein